MSANTHLNYLKSTSKKPAVTVLGVSLGPMLLNSWLKKSGVRSLTNTQWSEGFYTGVSKTRESIVNFLLSHMDAGATLTMDEIIKEIEAWEKQDSEHGLRDLSTGMKVVLMDSDGNIND
jgi:hypothetical protein